jgi:hypothetical protein
MLRTTHSPPVAPDPASRRRSYGRLQAGVGMPEEDLHLSDQTHLQVHYPPAEPGALICEPLKAAVWGR